MARFLNPAPAYSVRTVSQPSTSIQCQNDPPLCSYKLVVQTLLILCRPLFPDGRTASISIYVKSVYLVNLYFHICQNSLPYPASISVHVRTTYLVGLYSRRQNSLPSVVSLYSGHLDSLPLGVSLYFIRQNCLLYLLGLYSRRQKSLPCWPVFQSQNNLFRGVGLYSTMSEQPHVFHSVGTSYLISLYVFHNVRTFIDCHPVFQSQNDIPPCQLVFRRHNCLALSCNWSSGCRHNLSCQLAIHCQNDQLRRHRILQCMAFVRQSVNTLPSSAPKLNNATPNQIAPTLRRHYNLLPRLLFSPHDSAHVPSP